MPETPGTISRPSRVHLGARVLLLLVCVLPAFSGCTDEESATSAGADSPDLRILATDAPFPFDRIPSATVQVSSVTLRRTDGEVTPLRQYAEARTLDLANLRNGVVDVLYEGRVPDGQYDAVGITVRAVRVLYRGSGLPEPIPLTGSTEGREITVPLTGPVRLGAEGSRTILLDFDLSRSLVAQWAPEEPERVCGFQWFPVLHAVDASPAAALVFRVRGKEGRPEEPSEGVPLDGAEYALRQSSPPFSVVARGASGPNPRDPTVGGFARLPALPAGAYLLEVRHAGHTSQTRRLQLVPEETTDLGTLVLPGGVTDIEGRVKTEMVPLGQARVLPVSLQGATAELVSRDGLTLATDTTNGMGDFHLPALDAPQGRLRVRKGGYESVALPLESREARGVLLTPKTGDLTGHVRGRTGQPLGGARVRAVYVHGEEPNVIARARADENGRYTLTALPTGLYRIQVWDAEESGNVIGEIGLEHVGGDGSRTLDLTPP